ncbi:unnamed protein product [Triticum turgidum subsp. durum]|uniref:Nematode resistance protein-like HSPRO2 n=1 Tax=Triticum turgidum subsp. durum TaxID=4567 RepID=A0A9R1QQU4_TRITD|nr:unnamed protein product [Triticum turgidum subsp. durum]
MATTKLSPLSPVRPDDRRRAPAASVVLKVQDSTAAEAYEQYLRLPELSRVWKTACCPGWPDEGLVKPALQALEITFRFVSVALSDPRGYASRRELARRLESLTAREVEVVAALCEGDRGAPLAELSASEGVLPRERSASEVWQLPGSAAAVVCHASEASLLPRLAAWDKSETLAAKIKYAIESQMQGCAFSLGLGEPNLAGKPVLEYDRIVQPHELHALKPRVAPEPKTGYRNRENEALFTIHQILESWLCAASQLLTRLNSRIEAKDWEAAANDCWILERIWKLLADIEDLHLLMDPERGEGEDAGKIELLQAFQAVEAAVRRFFFAYRQVVAAVCGTAEASGNRALFAPAEGTDPLSQMFLEPPPLFRQGAAESLERPNTAARWVATCHGDDP